MDSSTQPSIGIVGNGLVGTRVALHLNSLGVRTLPISHKNIAEAMDCSTVVLAQGGKHAPLASSLVGHGINVISVGDNLQDTIALLDLHERAVANNCVVIPGASCAPGLTGLLVQHMTRAFDSVDEAHVAMHGTGGPQCARHHHDFLAGTSIGWHDGEWMQWPAGSGRELCWFPDPVGARDCYRFGSAEPLMLQRMKPELTRITARVSATRRDRLTARLPMLTPPHSDPGLGALRVEVRGTRKGMRHSEVVGVAERVASIAGAVAAHATQAVLSGHVNPGVHTLGQASLPNDQILDGVLATGITLHQFVGG
jgi:hypothetical protein